MGNLDVELEPNKNRVKTELDQARDTLRNAAWLGTDEEREQIEKAVELLCGEPCEDAISRQAAIDCLTATKLKKFDFILQARAEIKKLPPVTPKQRTGHWIDNHNNTISCDSCHTWFNKDDRYGYMHYCPYCNAKMSEIQTGSEPQGSEVSE